MPSSTPLNFADRFIAAMYEANDLYEDVIGAVDAVLPGAFMTQLGGMCLAIEAPVEGGWVWVTDKDGSLPWKREHHQGWSAALFVGNPLLDEGSDPHRHGDTDDSSLGGLLALLQTVVYGSVSA